MDIRRYIPIKPKIRDLTEDEKGNLTKRNLDNTEFCCIYDPIKRATMYRNVPARYIPDDSIAYPWQGFKGTPTHFLGVEKDGKFWPIFKNGHTVHDKAASPLILTIATKKAEKFLPILFKYKTSTMEKIKIGILVAFSFIELIILFFIVTTLMGGTSVV